MAICKTVSCVSIGIGASETYVFKLRLTERRAVGGNEDELGLAGADGLHGGLGAHGNLTRLHNESQAGGEAVSVSVIQIGGKS